MQAISRSEGLHLDAFAGRFAVRLASEEGSADRSFVLHDSADFELAPLDRSEAAEHLEYAPDTLRLEWSDDRSIHLDVDLDLFETLMRIRDGFTPSREELRGAWLNLRTFKDRVASLPADSLLLSARERHLFEIGRVSGEAGVSVRRIA